VTWSAEVAILKPMNNRASDGAGLERDTLVLDMVRAVPQGLIDAAASSLYLLIAVDALNAGGFSKSVIAASISAGLLVSPSVATWAARVGIAVTRLAALIVAVGALAMTASLVSTSSVAFTLGALGGLASTSMIIPLITTMYLSNYREGRRGRYLSTAYSVRVAS
jgi:hypothetical protein